MLTAEDTGLMRYALLSDSTAELLRARVRRLGGDAIVGLGEVIQDDGVTTTHTVSGSTTADTAGSATSIQVKTDVTPNRTRRLQGLVVRFTREDCRD